MLFFQKLDKLRIILDIFNNSSWHMKKSKKYLKMEMKKKINFISNFPLQHVIK